MFDKIKFEKYIILGSNNLIQALEKLNSNDKLTLIVLNENNQVIGTITDGDIRRAILKGLSIDSPILDFMHNKFVFIEENGNDISIVRNARKANIRLLPVINKSKELINIIDLTKQKSHLPIEAILMAGGRGERLRPLTDNIPKPLLKLGNRAIIEYNIENLFKFGIVDVNISVKYLSEKVIDFLGSGDKYGLNIKYLIEEFPLGTIGAASLIKNFKSDTILVMNSDLFTNIDLEDFYLHFIESKADMAVASFPYEVSVPYGVLNTIDTDIKSFSEKPTYTFHASAGMYLIKKEIIDLVPSNKYFNATDLMDLLILENKKIVYFPIVGYWIDIGKPEDYKKAQEYVKYL